MVKKVAPIVLIVIDAMRWDYINPDDSPFLWSLSIDGIYAKKLKPNLGFCERTEMFTGTKPRTNQNFTAITFDFGKSEFYGLKNEIAVYSFLDSFKSRPRRYIRRLLREYFKRLRRIHQPIYEIPLKLLPYLSLTEDVKELYEEGALEVESIFDVMAREDGSFFFDTFASLKWHPGPDEKRIEQVKESFQEEYDLYLIYLGEGDYVGHFHGPCSYECRKMVSRQDERVRKIMEAFNEKFSNPKFLFIGDHGMVEVTNHVNLWGMTDKLFDEKKLKEIKDYFRFFDSTLARFWFHNDVSRKIIEEFFQNNVELNKFGKVLTETEAKEYHIPAPSKKYGDLVWLANPGTVIYPDYFHFSNKPPVVGMHGYDTSLDAQKGFAIIYYDGIKKRRIEQCELVDICPTMCDLIGIPAPEANQGVSLLQVV